MKIDFNEVAKIYEKNGCDEAAKFMMERYFDMEKIKRLEKEAKDAEREYNELVKNHRMR